MSKLGVFGFLFALGLYSLCFWKTDSVYLVEQSVELNPPLAAKVQKVMLPYLRQLAAEVTYIKSVTYIGAVIKMETEKNVNMLAKNFAVMQQMHPYLLDTYYVTYAYLPGYDDAITHKANAILKKGMESLPNDWTLPFHIGFNYFYYLKDNDSAYAYLLKAYELSKNPFFKHLASVLAGKDGDLKTGAIWLRAMYEERDDPEEKEILLADIKAYDVALSVQSMVKQYHDDKGEYPSDLNALIPDYLTMFPAIDARFEIVYEGDGVVRLKRPKLH